VGGLGKATQLRI